MITAICGSDRLARPFLPVANSTAPARPGVAAVISQADRPAETPMLPATTVSGRQCAQHVTAEGAGAGFALGARDPDDRRGTRSQEDAHLHLDRRPGLPRDRRNGCLAARPGSARRHRPSAKSPGSCRPSTNRISEIRRARAPARQVRSPVRRSVTVTVAPRSARYRATPERLRRACPAP